MMYSPVQLTYLEHLGIDVWVPKQAPVLEHNAPATMVEPVQELAATKPMSEQAFTTPAHYEDVPQTQVVSIPQVNDAQAAEPMASSNPQVVPPASAQPVMKPSNLNSALTSPIPAPAFPAQTQAPEAQAQRLEFHLQFWCYSSGVWIVSGDVNVTPEQHKLVHNIAQFVQGKKRRPRHVNVFSWPMIDSPNVDQGADIASKYLLAHIERLQQACEQKTVIVFDDCPFFPQQIPHVRLSTTLSAVLAQASTKKALWQQLSPFQLQD